MKDDDEKVERVMFGVRLDRDIRDWLEEEGRKRRVPASQVMREILLEKMRAARGRA